MTSRRSAITGPDTEVPATCAMWKSRKATSASTPRRSPTSAFGGETRAMWISRPRRRRCAACCPGLRFVSRHVPRHLALEFGEPDVRTDRGRCNETDLGGPAGRASGCGSAACACRRCEQSGRPVPPPGTRCRTILADTSVWVMHLQTPPTTQSDDRPDEMRPRSRPRWKLRPAAAAGSTCCSTALLPRCSAHARPCLRKGAYDVYELRETCAS